ncbi:MAG: hypothetical protein ACI8S7_001854, partial [Candidatus Krumholzibacteriia bacterium]
KDKRQRDQRLLRKVLRDDPRDFYCWFKLLESARYWQDTELWRAAATQVDPILRGELSDGERKSLMNNHWSGELAALISRGLPIGPEQALIWLDQTKSRVRCSSAWHLQRGLWSELLDRSSDAAEAFASCLADKRGSANHHHVRAHLGLSRLAAGAGNLTQASEWAMEALKSAPRDVEAVLAVISFSPQSLTSFVDSQVTAHPDSAQVWAEQLIGSGNIKLAQHLLNEMSVPQPHLAMGHLVCALASGDEFELEVELSAEDAEIAFRHWIRVLWRSRQVAAMSRFADECYKVQELFPWLAEFLAAETELLKNESSAP